MLYCIQYSDARMEKKIVKLRQGEYMMCCAVVSGDFHNIIIP